MNKKQAIGNSQVEPISIANCSKMPFIYSHGSLFSGIGGFDLAAEQAGLKNVFHCEFERFNGKSSYENVRMDDGFSEELDKSVIHGFGNAVIPEIPYQIFRQLTKAFSLQ